MDHISNLLTSLRNAEMAGNQSFTSPYSKLSLAILSILQKEGFVHSFETIAADKKQSITVSLPQPVLTHHYRRISTPGRRLYVSADKIPTILRGLGSIIISTPNGVMTGKEARKQKVGGEMICEFY